MEGASANEDAPRRTVYLSIDRAALNELFSTFDYVEPANHIEQRPVTTVPGQALYLLNSPLVHRQAARIATELIELTADPETRVRQLWTRLHGRPPRDQDSQRMLRFVEEAKTVISGDDNAKEHGAWASLCRTLIAGSRFCYVQ